MQSLKFLSLLLLCLPSVRGVAQVAYANDFSSPASIQDFSVYGERFVSYNPPPLHNVEVTQGQLQITTSYQQPNGPGTNPTLFGAGFLMGSTASFQAGYTSTLSNNRGLVSWSFNIANQDGNFNNGFSFVLGSSIQDAIASNAQGYVLSGGGFVGNRMILYRFNSGVQSGGTIVIDLTNGLGTLPQMGSYKVTFDPLSGVWSLFGTTGSQFVDPASVNTLLGFGLDATYTRQTLPYFGFGGYTTGLDVFDNVGVTVVPEPTSVALIGLTALAAVALRYQRRNEQI